VAIGRIDFDQPFGNNIDYALKALKNLGYQSTVTTTERQLESMLQNLKVSVPELVKRTI